VSITYYKVITDDRFSAFVRNPKVRVKYPVGKWVQPQIEGSKLLAFSNQQSAGSWARSGIRGGRNLIVVPCYCKNVIEASDNYLPVINVQSWYNDLQHDEVSNFWKYFKKLTKKYTLKNIFTINTNLNKSVNISGHYGSIFCSSLKCLE